MKILFYDAKPYDTEMFERASSDYNGISIDYLAADISEKKSLPDFWATPITTGRSTSKTR